MDIVQNETNLVLFSNGCKMYRMRLSHIFDISSISNENPGISMEISSISIEYLEFRSKY